VTPFATSANTISPAVLINAGGSSKMPIFVCWPTRYHIQKALLFRCGRKIAKATISFVVSVCQSVRMEQFGFHCTDFHYIWYLSTFRKHVEKILFVSHLRRVTDTSHEDVFTFMTSCWILLRMRNVSDKSCRENQNIFYVQFFFFEIPPDYEIMWTDHIWQYGACALRAGYLKLQAHIKNM
jgi:hypothetical protein